MFSRIRTATLSALITSLFWAGGLSLISDEYIKMIEQKDARVQRYQILLGEASQLSAMQQQYLEAFAARCIQGDTFKLGHTEFRCYALQKALNYGTNSNERRIRNL